MDALHRQLYEALIDCVAIVRLQNGNLHDDTNQLIDKAEQAIEAYENEVCRCT